MTEIEKRFNDYCESNSHRSEMHLKEKALARWAQREIALLRIELNETKKDL